MTRIGLMMIVVAMACGDDDGVGRDAAVGDSATDSAADSAVADSGADVALGDSAMDSRTDASPMADADIMFPDAGGLLPPEWVDLEVGPAGSCPDPVACGGDVVGTWDLTGGCFELDAESGLSRCPGAQVTRRSGTGRGRVVFGADGFAHRVAESVVEADVFFPSICAAVFSCEMLESAMAALATDATCTTEASGDCNCTTRLVTVIDDRDAYSIEGNEIVGTRKRWEYCIEVDTLSYWDTSPSGPREPGIIELGRR